MNAQDAKFYIVDKITIWTDEEENERNELISLIEELKQRREDLKMYSQDVINLIDKIWFYADREEMSLEEYKELAKKKKEAVEYIKKLSGVH